MSTTKPSATALLIAKSQCVLGRQKRFEKLFSSEMIGWYEKFLYAAGFKLTSHQIFDWHYLRLKILERFSIPGMYLHYCLRKKEIHKQLLSLLSDGNISQVVVLAAGLDPLCAVLAPSFPNVSFFEIDLPATQEIKKAVFKSSTNHKNLTLLPSSRGLGQIAANLENSSFIRESPTAFILEGITMYLTSDEVSELLRTLYNFTSQGGKLFITFMEKWGNGSIQFKNASPLVTPWLWLNGEPFKWGIRREELAGFLSKHGWQLEALVDHDIFRDNYLVQNSLESESLAIGECLAFTSKHSPLF